MNHLSYPRLSSSDATELLVRCYQAERDELLELAEAYSGRAFYSATASRRVHQSHIDQIRNEIHRLAGECGFPAAKAPPGFDAALPSLLGGLLQLAPSEAGRVEVWNYLTLVVMPDIALWRWPSESMDPSYERLIGKPRNVFRRHWWRWYLLGADITARLTEDELVQIVERATSLGGDPRVAKALARQHLHHLDTRRLVVEGRERAFVREALMRDAAKRVLRIGRVVALSALPDNDLDQLMEEMVDRAAKGQAQSVSGLVGVLGSANA